MSPKKHYWFLLGLVISGLVLMVLLPGLSIFNPNLLVSAANAQQGCVQLVDPKEMPAAALIDFDDLSDGQVIGNSYRSSHGVVFEESRTNRALIYKDPINGQSPPNVAINDAIFPDTSSNVPLVIRFNTPKTHVGFWIGNGENLGITATLIAYDSNNNPICELMGIPVPESLTQFVGFADPEGRIVRIELDYGVSAVSETIDDLYFSPKPDAIPTRTPLPTWTPVPSSTPTPGPTPTPTPLVPMLSYKPVAVVSSKPFILNQDLSIHGIEITQGIQCFNTNQGVTNCADNSLPMVAKKDTTARIYLKYNALLGSSMSNVPVRLFIRASGTWYTANATGKATSVLNQGNDDSADIYFNVNFNEDIKVDFYAIVDPDGVVPEVDESNNRYPAGANTYITLDFRTRDPLKIVGQRVRYHPGGYTGSQYASGWAVNGGASDWFEQLLPISNNGVNYSVKSGYLDWTKSLTPCNSGSGGDNQHGLIQTLNLYWILENSLSWIFGTGAFTGADHVFGWVPNDGYPCGHADMPVYPHAGGLGVVAIGSDAPGTNTDNPGAGALIFGHELVHNYDVKHTDTADSCGSTDNSSPFPYASSSIQEFGVNPYTGKIYNPASTHDLMSYCPSSGSKQGWISPYTWNLMFNKLSPGTAMADVRKPEDCGAGFFYLTGGNESLVINATLFNPDYNPPNLGELGDLYRINGGLAYNVTAGDQYTLELWDLYGGSLASYSFDVNFESEYDAHAAADPSTATPPFSPDPSSQQGISFIIPWEDGTASVALRHLGDLIDVQGVSDHPPKVVITNPSGSVSWAAGTVQPLEWTGSDTDGDSLKYSVMYSSNGGADWVLIVSDLIDTSYEIDVDSMAGGNDVRFRVVATDGVNIGYDETDAPISIPNHPPLVSILNPGNKRSFLPGSLVVLQGAATDMEDGSLPEDALTWSSDLQGGLGIGPSVPLNNLVKGWHTITLNAVDSFGISSSAQVMIFIGYQTFLPGILN